METENTAKGRTLEDMRASADRFAESRTKTTEVVPPTELEKAYAKHIQEQREKAQSIEISGILDQYASQNRKLKFKPYGISLDDAKKILYVIIKEELLFRGDTLVLDGNTPEVLHKLTSYFIGEDQGESGYDLKKGIYLYGDVGRGKTFIMECLEKMCKAIETRFESVNKPFTPRSFKLVTVKEVIRELSSKKSLDSLDKYNKGNLLIDDLGNEKDFGDTQKVYGNEYDVIGDVITERYKYFKMVGAITHATSNLLPGEWKKAYKTRVEDRLYDMFNIVFLDGESKRVI